MYFSSVSKILFCDLISCNLFLAKIMIFIPVNPMTMFPLLMIENNHNYLAIIGVYSSFSIQACERSQVTSEEHLHAARLTREEHKKRLGIQFGIQSQTHYFSCVDILKHHTTNTNCKLSGTVLCMFQNIKN